VEPKFGHIEENIMIFYKGTEIMVVINNSENKYE